MTVTLRLVLDQLIDVVDPDAAEAAREIAAALVRTAPRGCAVGAIVPAGAENAAAEIAGLADVWRAPLARPALAASWQLGIAPGIGGGLIHAPGPLAPLVRHDRVNDNDQTVVTLWELCAWEIPGDLPRGAVAAQRALMRRTEKFADAVVVPTHALAAKLGEVAPRLAGRVRVIPGAAPQGFTVPSDAVGRRRELGVAEDVIVVAGSRCDDAAFAAAFSAIGSRGCDRGVVVMDAAAEEKGRVRDLASAAGLAPERVSVHAHLSAGGPGVRAGYGERTRLPVRAQRIPVAGRRGAGPGRAHRGDGVGGPRRGAPRRRAHRPRRVAFGCPRAGPRLRGEPEAVRGPRR
ncbi:hypothetical protein QE377_000610 [Microbacterium sp. SORGH_AS 862]|nr:hypothetical protein [Microbacterium sp. SORGH_AS_0862]